LSISFEEISAGKIQLVQRTIEDIVAENEAAVAAEEADLAAELEAATEPDSK
jgi:hypothetical protein